MIFHHKNKKLHNLIKLNNYKIKLVNIIIIKLLKTKQITNAKKNHGQISDPPFFIHIEVYILLNRGL